MVVAMMKAMATSTDAEEETMLAGRRMGRTDELERRGEALQLQAGRVTLYNDREIKYLKVGMPEGYSTYRFRDCCLA